MHNYKAAPISSTGSVNAIPSPPADRELDGGQSEPTDKLKNDIALTVANSYLQILLRQKEQEKIAGIQLQQSTAQLNNTRKLVDAGACPN